MDTFQTDLTYVNIETIKQIIKSSQNRIDLNTQCHTNQNMIWHGTILHRAARANRLDIVKYLVESGADINASNNEGTTPLYAAVIRKYYGIVTYLLENGANPDTCANTGFTPLTFSITRNDINMVILLLDHGADKEYRHMNGRTAVEWANVYGYDDIKQLIESYELVPVKGVYV